MGKNKKGTKTYTDGAEVDIIVNGIDDPNVKDTHKAPLHNIEAGSWIHGLLRCRVPYLPAQPVALAKFSISGSHTIKECKTEHYRDDEGEIKSHTTTKYDDEKWLKRKEKTLLQANSVSMEPDKDRLYTMWFPFSFQLAADLCDSFKSKHTRTAVWYELKVKVKFPTSDLKLKTKRPIDVMRHRPHVGELSRKANVDSEKHRSILGGQVKATVTLNEGLFYEGSQVVFTAHIENGTGQPVMVGKVELEEEHTQTVKSTSDANDHKHWSTTRCRRDVRLKRLRGLEIMPGTEQVLRFSLDLPPVVEPPTTHVNVKHHITAVRHFLKLRLSVPWAKDVCTEFPVIIVPDPRRYAMIQPPPELMQVGPVDMSTLEGIQMPATYAPLQPQPVLPMEWDPKRKTVLQLAIISAKDLPKMDVGFSALRGGADPYVTVVVNDQHVQCTEVKKGTRKPEWNEMMLFALEADYDLNVQPLKIHFKCFDYDRMSKDDRIGSGTIELTAENCNEYFSGEPFKVDLELDHPKKGTLQRGTVMAAIRGFSPM